MNAPNIVKLPVEPKASRAQQAIATFVFTTLIGPAIGAAILAAIYLISGLVGMGPPSIKTLKPGELLPYVAVRTLDGYVWSALPAGLSGAVLAAIVYLRGTFPWLAGVAAAAVAATLMAIVSGGQAAGHAYFIALIAGVAAVLGRLALVAAKVID